MAGIYVCSLLNTKPIHAQLLCMDTHLENWNEIRTAWMVARHGSLSAAAQALGVHHATVLRQVAALETRLGVRLFQRHSRGYTPTDAGQTLFKVATSAAEQFDLLPARLANPDTAISGKLIITTVPELADKLIPTIANFQRDHPDIQIELLSESRLLRLEYGEAHVSIRAGAPPSEPDNIARPLSRLSATMFAHRDYIARHGRPDGLEDIAGHRYITMLRVDQRLPPLMWIEQTVPPEQIVFRGSDHRAMQDAAQAGMGIMPMITWPQLEEPELVELFPPPADWSGDLWLVTHRDNHRIPKVQAFREFLLREVGEKG